jgi:hypothetical protein
MDRPGLPEPESPCGFTPSSRMGSFSRPCPPAHLPAPFVCLRVPRRGLGFRPEEMAATGTIRRNLEQSVEILPGG